MGHPEVNGVGRFKVEIEVVNHADMVNAKNGALEEAKVRREQVPAVVDSGAMHLVLPQSVVKRLGLSQVDRLETRYADGRRATRDVVGSVFLDLMGRHSIFAAIVEPKRHTALIGAIVLEALDLLVDCKNQCLVPRDPRMAISEIE